MSRAYRGDVTFRGPALFSRLSWQNISVCVFLDSNGRIRWNRSILRWISFRISTLQSSKSEEKAQALFSRFEADKEVIFKSTGSAVKQRNAFPSIPPTLPVQPSPSSVYRMQSNVEKMSSHVSLCSEVEKRHLWNCLCHREEKNNVTSAINLAPVCPPHLLNKTHHPTHL